MFTIAVVEDGKSNQLLIARLIELYFKKHQDLPELNLILIPSFEEAIKYFKDSTNDCKLAILDGNLLPLSPDKPRTHTFFDKNQKSEEKTENNSSEENCNNLDKNSGVTLAEFLSRETEICIIPWSTDKEKLVEFRNILGDKPFLAKPLKPGNLEQILDYYILKIPTKGLDTIPLDSPSNNSLNP